MDFKVTARFVVFCFCIASAGRLIYFITILVLAGCTAGNSDDASVRQAQHYGLAPVTVLLDKRPPPKSFVLQPDAMPRKIEISTDAGEIARTTRTIVPPRTTAAAQPISSFTHFGTEQGLSLSVIAAACVDRLGNLWFGTAGGGVSLFDGTNFTTFTTRHGLGHNTVRAIMEDKTGNVWFGTNGGGVSLYNGTSFTTFTTEHGLTHNRVRALTADSKGNLWIATEGGGVSRFDGKTFTTLSTSEGLAHNIVWSIAEDKDGNIWFATDLGASRFDGKSFTTYSVKHGLAHNSVRSVTLDKHGNLWFGTIGGVSVYDGKRFTSLTTRQGLVNNRVKVALEDKKGNLWFGTDGGLSRYDGTAFVNLTTRQGLLNNAIRTITEDKSGNLWFGTEGGGVSRYDGTNITTFTTEQGLPFNITRCIIEDRRGNLWFATQGGGVSRYDGSSFTTFTTVQGLVNDEVWSITEDKNGNLWFGSATSGVSRYDGRSLTTYKVEQGLANNSVRGFTEDTDGNLWIGTEGGGVSRYDGRSFTTFTTEHGLADNDVRSIAQDRNGNLWFSTNGGGISRFDGESFTTFTTAQGLPSNVVWSIEEDIGGNLWFGTGSGACRYDGRSFTTLTTVQGLSDDVVYDIVEDDQGVLWFGTNAGISGLKFSSSETEGKGSEIKGAGLLAISNEAFSRMTPMWEIYNTKTGYPVKSINLNAMCISRKGLPSGVDKGVGIIWSGCGDNKVIRFDPSANTNNTNRPQVFVKDIKIDGTTIDWYGFEQRENDSTALAQQEAMTYGRLLQPAERETIQRELDGVQFDSLSTFHHVPLNLVLPYHLNQLGFDFGMIETGRNFLVRYQYVLEGYDKEWSPVTDKTSVTYGNIREGDYEFKLKSKGIDGVWGDPITYKFSVLPPWWRSWWAYSAYGLLIAGSLLLGRKAVVQQERLKLNLKLAKVEQEKQHFELEKAREVDKIKTTFFTNISHEFRTPLTLIKGPVQNLLEEFKDHQQVKGQLMLVHRNSDQLLKLINQFLDLAKLESGSLTVEKTKEDLNLFFSTLANSFLSFAQQKNITLSTELPATRYRALLDKGKLETILINLINNAIKFTPAGGAVTVKIQVSTQDVSTERQSAGTVSSGEGRGEALTFIVSDTGIGIPEDQQTKIFERFYQVSDAHNEVGTGIGLALVKELVTLMGGSIEIKSKSGNDSGTKTGSEFTIVLPIEDVSIISHMESNVEVIADRVPGKISNVKYPHVQESAYDEFEITAPKVLVVEDNVDLRSFIVNSLGTDFHFLEAGDGKQGMERAFDEIPDLIISDVMMPEMDGIMMTGKLKKDLRTSHIPIILLTAKASEDSKLEGLGIGADDYITKPFNKNELLLKVRNSIAQRVKMRERLRLELLKENPKVAVQSADEQLMWKIKEAILARLGDELLSVESLAEEIGLSRSQLVRKVSAMTGISVNEMIRTLRLQKAAQLLEQKWGLVPQVAREVGFPNLSYFNKVFKEQYGVLPAEYAGKSV